MGRILIIAGLLIFLIGLVYSFFPSIFSWVGKLPGDIKVEKGNGGFYFPITTCIILSLFGSLLLKLLSKLF